MFLQVLSSGNICAFHDLVVHSVAFDEIMRCPEQPRKHHIVIFETKSLRDTRLLLKSAQVLVRTSIFMLAQSLEWHFVKTRVPFVHLNSYSLQDACEFVELNSHPRLWRLVAEQSLKSYNLDIAEKAFMRCMDYYCISFVKHLKVRRFRFLHSSFI